MYNYIYNHIYIYRYTPGLFQGQRRSCELRYATWSPYLQEPWRTPAATLSVFLRENHGIFRNETYIYICWLCRYLPWRGLKIWRVSHHHGKPWDFPMKNPQPPLVISYSSNPQEKSSMKKFSMFSYYHYHILSLSLVGFILNMFYVPFHIWELLSSFYYHY